MKLKLQKFKINKRKASFFISFILVLILMIFLFGLFGYRINLSPSMPIGVWRITGKELKAGHIAIFYPPVKRDKDPLLKSIVAVEGDIVTLLDDYIEINGNRLQNSITYKKDSSNAHVTAYPRGIYQVKPNEVWLISEYHNKSYDSRYFGPINKEQIIAIMEPVWIYP